MDMIVSKSLFSAGRMNMTKGLRFFYSLILFFQTYAALSGAVDRKSSLYDKDCVFKIPALLCLVNWDAEFY
jgi:hypothetical protein